MKFDYNALLSQQLYSLQATLGLSDFEFFVDSEQSFLKEKDLKPNSIYVLTKELQSDKSIGVDTQPVQILVLTEQDSLEIAKAFFSKFAEAYNFKAITQTYEENDVQHSIWVKQQYSDPVVLSNFNTISYGYRSVMYVSATLYVMYDVVDLKNLKIDGETVNALTFDLAYNMSPNTQQLGGTEFISKSVKSVSTMAITVTIPVVKSDLTEKVLKIMDEADATTTDQSDAQSYGGNENFYFDFYLGDYHFESKKFKLTVADFGAAVNDIPAIRLGFMK